ncbi:7070_t:CDS:2, partial [Funneliformis mosseae]
ESSSEISCNKSSNYAHAGSFVIQKEVLHSEFLLSNVGNNVLTGSNAWNRALGGFSRTIPEKCTLLNKTEFQTDSLYTAATMANVKIE